MLDYIIHYFLINQILFIYIILFIFYFSNLKLVLVFLFLHIAFLQWYLLFILKCFQSILALRYILFLVNVSFKDCLI